MTATILLAGPDSSHRSVWEAFLRGKGYKVFAATDGAAALEESQDIQPDLVLLNDPLTHARSLEICQQLKSDRLTQLTPVVLIMPLGTDSANDEPPKSDSDGLWGNPSSAAEALGRVQALLELRAYVDQQTQAWFSRWLEASRRGIR